MGIKIKRRCVLSLAAVLFVFTPELSLAQQPEPEPESAPTISITVLRALDKITARISELEVPAGQEINFGSLAITARICRSEPPEEKPETYAFLEIDDVRKSGERVRIFTGWMLASSPALNPLEHPVYDVWVISCKISSADVKSEREEKSPSEPKAPDSLSR